MQAKGVNEHPQQYHLYFGSDAPDDDETAHGEAVEDHMQDTEGAELP